MILLLYKQTEERIFALIEAELGFAGIPFSFH